MTDDSHSSEGGELIDFPGKPKEHQDPLAHLVENRRLVVRRSLFATAVGGLVPLPVMDDYLAGRVKAGMLLRLADRRRVDVDPSTAELLADSPESSRLRQATLTAATLVALKLAWRKFFAVLAVGRRSEEMATTFQLGTLFDHFCFRLHVGAGLDRKQATRLRVAAHRAIMRSERQALVTVFQEGGRILARSVLEAPAWMGDRLQRAAADWSRSGGQSVEALGIDDTAGDARWLDRAADRVDNGLSRLGTAYLSRLVAAFEDELRADEPDERPKP